MAIVRYFVLSLLFWGSAASAEDWWYLGVWGEGRDSFHVYVESQTAQSDGKRTVSGWVFTHRLIPYPNGEMAARAWTTVDCETRRYVTGQRTAYDADNRPISTADLSSQVHDAQPNTMASALVDTACGRTRPASTGIPNPLIHSLNEFRAAGASANVEPVPPSLSSGTGFFIGSAGHILTSHHVVEGASQIACRTVAGQVHEARLIRSSAANDVALLQVNVRPTHFLGFAAPGSAREGDRVFTMGFPVVNVLGVEPRFTDGTISALSFAGENVFLQTSIPVHPGNSGGPVVNERGQVIGIVAATVAIEPFYRETGVLPQNVNWAVKAEYASPLLPPMPAAPVRTREDAIAMVRNSICLVVAERNPQ